MSADAFKRAGQGRAGVGGVTCDRVSSDPTAAIVTFLVYLSVSLKNIH